MVVSSEQDGKLIIDFPQEIITNTRKGGSLQNFQSNKGKKVFIYFFFLKTLFLYYRLL